MGFGPISRFSGRLNFLIKVRKISGDQNGLMTHSILSPNIELILGLFFVMFIKLPRKFWVEWVLAYIYIRFPFGPFPSAPHKS